MKVRPVFQLVIFLCIAMLYEVLYPQLPSVSLPANFPGFLVEQSINPSPGYLYLSNMWSNQPYLMVFDNSGNTLFYRQIPGNAYDFKQHPNGFLSYYIQSDINRFYIMDSTYSVIDSITGDGSNYPNEHELRILPNGNYLLIMSETRQVDMSSIVPGGSTEATVLGNHVFELAPDKSIVFDWKSWDHYAYTDAIGQDLTGGFIDYVHMNAIAIDLDGNLLVSNRNMSEISKINRTTSDLMWRMGGRNNQFVFINDPDTFTFENQTLAFAYQHHIQVLPNGNYILFDNGNLRPDPFSRVMEIAIDTTDMICDLIWAYRHDPDIYSAWMGSVQRLENGNTLIGWSNSNSPKVTEVTANGEIVFQGDFVSSAVNYRANKISWLGQTKKPDLIVEPHYNRIRLIFNQFGVSDISHFNIYGDTFPNPHKLLLSTAEKEVDLTDLTNGLRYFFRVTSVDSSGNESEYSNEESVLVNYTEPGQNLLLNGDFTNEDQNWILSTFDSAQAFGIPLSSGEYFINISNGGLYTWSIQLVQSGITMVEGTEYILEFDAFALEKRTIDVKIEKNGSPWTNYSRTSAILLEESTRHYSFQFSMNDPTDFDARVSFNCGITPVGVIIDNVALYALVPTVIGAPPAYNPQDFVLYPNYPNPFNSTTIIRYQVPYTANVNLQIFDIRGRLLKTISNQLQRPGIYEIPLSLGDVASGIYTCHLEVDGRVIQSRKLVLIK